MRKLRVLPKTALTFAVVIGLLAGNRHAALAGVTYEPAAPIISFVAISNVTASSATITWQTDVPSDSQVEYGTTYVYDNMTTLDPALVTQHRQTISGLTAGTTYYFRVRSRDAGGNLAISLWDYTFKTTGAPDQDPPVISGVAVADLTSSGAAVYWKTSEPSDSQIAFGVGGQYNRLSAHDPAMVTLHAVTLNGLSAGTIYHYRIMSRDAAGNLGMSEDLTLTTPVGPPIISGVAVSKIGPKGATISWSTDVPADTQVAYGTDSDCGLATALNPALTGEHSQKIDGLDPATTYYFRVLSTNAAGQSSIGGLGSFQTVAVSSTFELQIPRLATKAASGTAGFDDSMYAGIAMVNLGTEPAVLTFTAYDTLGNRISDLNIVNPTQRVLAPGGQLAVLDADLFGAGLPLAGQVGWIDVVSTSFSVIGSSTLFNGSVSVLDGAPMVADALKSFIFPEIDEQGPTDLHIANSNEIDAYVLLFLVTADGEPISYAARTLAPFGAMAESAATLFPDAVIEPGDSILGFSEPGVTAYEMLGTAPRDVAGLNALDAAAGSTTLYSPHYAVGSMYRTALSIVEVEGLGADVTFSLFGDDGVQIGSSQTATVPAYGKIYISDPAFFGIGPDQEVSGYVTAESSGGKILGSVTFEDAARAAFRTALPLVSSLQGDLVFPQIASDATYFTGLALLNPSAAAVTATVNLYLPDGSLKDSTSLTLPAHNRASRLLTDLFPALGAQSSGYLRVAAPGGVAGFSVFGTLDMKTLAAVPAQSVR